MSDPLPEQQSAKKTRVILLVDDSAADRTIIRRLLAQDPQADYAVHEATKVEDALKSFREKRPHAVLLDHHLPDGNGIELLEALQEETETEGGTAFVMLTATAGPDIAVEAMRRGAHDYLNKGRLQAAELRRALTNALEKAELAREIERQRAALLDKNRELERQLAERRKAERALHRSEALSQSIFEASADCIEVLDPEGLLRQINRTGERLLEIEDPASEVGNAWLGRWQTSAGEEAAAALESAKAGGNGRFQSLRPTLKDTSKWWDVVISPIKDLDGRVAGFVAISRDITEAKLHEQALAEAKGTAEAANRAKDEFLAALSHELRTPLNPVLLVASERAADPDLPADVADDFAAIRKNVELEARLIDDLLDLTRIERGKLRLEMERADLRQLLQASVDLLEPEIAGKNLEVTMEIPAQQLVVNADPVRLQQVFWNVIKNAVKFTPRQGRIAVSVRRSEDGWAKIEVRDNGEGIHPEEVENIFVSFNQGRSGHRFGGLGLGLAISRGLMELHGGRISASSEGLGKGATFVVNIPLAGTGLVAPPRPQHPAAEAGASEARLRILIAEDHEPTCATLAKLLRRRHYHVTTAASLEEAAKAAREGEFDIVLSDLGLPDGSGYQVLKAVRALQPKCRGIAVSGYGMDADVNCSLSAGFDAHLIKPVTVQTLMNAVEKASAHVGG